MSKSTIIHPVDKWASKQIMTYPRVINLARILESDRASFGSDWPEWCAMPMAAVGAILDQHGYKVYTQEYGSRISDLTAALLWSKYKTVYTFSPDLVDYFKAQPLDDELPFEVFKLLPYPCVFLQYNFGALSRGMTRGAFAWLEYDNRYQIPELRLHFLERDGHTMGVPLPIKGGDIAESYSEITAKGERVSGAKISDEKLSAILEAARIAVHMLLYLCADNADTVESVRLTSKKGLDHNGNPTSVRHWDVGVRIGRACKAAEAADKAAQVSDEPRERTSKRPHIRRAHWHRFWVGSERNGDRRLVLRWLPPIPVKVDSQGMPVVIFPQSKDN